MNTTERKSRICLDCANDNRLKWLPCQNHGLVIPSELCGHEHTSQTFIENGVGLLCHDCGITEALETA